jgi:hypothetical protein
VVWPSNNPAQFQALKFPSRFNGKPCLALFNRDSIDTRLSEIGDQPLPESDDAVDWLHKHKVILF